MKNKSRNIIIGGIVGGTLLSTGAYLYMRNKKTIPEGVEAVNDFEPERYLGKWYEIARMDFRFEKNLINTTAEYSLNKDGSIKVVNRGYNYVKDEYKRSEGRAKFVSSPDEAMLKVSFFGPLYSGYNVIAIDDEYKYAFVAGRNLDYMWLLSREKTIPKSIESAYLRKAKNIGYRIEDLVWVDQE